MREREREILFVTVRFPFLEKKIKFGKKVHEEKQTKTNNITTLHIYSYP